MVDISVVRIMTLNEADESEKNVGVVLDTQKKKKGVLWYLDKKGMIPINLIDAVFEDEDDNKGKVPVWISLLAGDIFEAPYVRTKSGKDLECVEFEPELGDSVIVLTFIEPNPGEVVYEELEFKTASRGWVDPSVSVRRGIGG